jgi:catechol 2,3-dioxygenase-like lactoylglutathione lyase family enzyme
MITGMPRIAIAVSDFDGVVSTFRDIFGMPVIDISDSSVASLGAKLAMCVPEGGSNIELMCPATPEAPLAQSLQRFLDKRGEGLFALMLEAPVPNDEAEVLTGNGLNVLPLMAGAGGRDIHPRSTHGVLIRVYPVNSFQGQMDPVKNALDITGITRVIIGVKDINEARAVYGEKLGMPIEEVQRNERLGVDSVLCLPPSGGVIELAAVADGSMAFAASLAEHLETRGEGMYALVLNTTDLDQANNILAERGLSLSATADGALETELHGARVRIEQN